MRSCWLGSAGFSICLPRRPQRSNNADLPAVDLEEVAVNDGINWKSKVLDVLSVNHLGCFGKVRDHLGEWRLDDYVRHVADGVDDVLTDPFSYTGLVNKQNIISDRSKGKSRRKVGPDGCDFVYARYIEFNARASCITNEWNLSIDSRRSILKHITHVDICGWGLQELMNPVVNLLRALLHQNNSQVMFLKLENIVMTEERTEVLTEILTHPLCPVISIDLACDHIGSVQWFLQLIKNLLTQSAATKLKRLTIPKLVLEGMQDENDIVDAIRTSSFEYLKVEGCHQSLTAMIQDGLGPTHLTIDLGAGTSDHPSDSEVDGILDFAEALRSDSCRLESLDIRVVGSFPEALAEAIGCLCSRSDSRLSRLTIRAEDLQPLLVIEHALRNCRLSKLQIFHLGPSSRFRAQSLSWFLAARLSKVDNPLRVVRVPVDQQGLEMILSLLLLPTSHLTSLTLELHSSVQVPPTYYHSEEVNRRERMHLICSSVERATRNRNGLKRFILCNVPYPRSAGNVYYDLLRMLFVAPPQLEMFEWNGNHHCWEYGVDPSDVKWTAVMVALMSVVYVKRLGNTAPLRCLPLSDLIRSIADVLGWRLTPE